MPKAKCICELIGVSKEKLELLIKKLKPEHQEFIKEKFDENYIRLDMNWNEEDRIFFYNKVRKSLKKLAAREINMGRHLKKHFTQKIRITKEKFLQDFHLYNKTVQDFTKKHFDENLCMLRDFDEWMESDKHFYLTGYIEHIKNISVNPKTRYNESLPEKFGVTKEEFQIIFQNLSNRAKELISMYYDNDFKPILSLNWKHSEKRYMFNYVYKKITEIINQGYLKPYQKTYGDLLAKYNITRSQMKYIASTFKGKYQEFLAYAFDDNFKIKRNINLSAEELKFMQTSLSITIKKSIKKYGIDIINHNTKIQLEGLQIQETLNDVFKPLSDPIVNYIPDQVSQTEKIQLLKSYYLAYYSYLNLLKQPEIKLTLKKD